MEKAIKKEFDTVEFFRTVKEKIGKLLAGKTFAEQQQIIQDIKNGKISIQ